jgi:hypothetical protein
MPHHTAYIEPEIPENGPILDEKCLFVRVLGLSGTAGGDSVINTVHSAPKCWLAASVDIADSERIPRCSDCCLAKCEYLSNFLHTSTGLLRENPKPWPKPKPDQAKPKPWFQGQAKPGHHYTRQTSELL